MLVKKAFPKSGGNTYKSKQAKKKPYSPNIAPEAPTLTVASYHQILATLAKMPVVKYTNIYFFLSKSGSRKMPTNKRPYISAKLCISPPCKNVLVNKRHHCPSVVSGLKLAPQFNKSVALNDTKPSPAKTIIM